MPPEQVTLSLATSSKIRKLTIGEVESALDACSGCSSRISLLLEILGPIGEAHLCHTCCAKGNQSSHRNSQFLRMSFLLCFVSIESEVFSKFLQKFY